MIWNLYRLVCIDMLHVAWVTSLVEKPNVIRRVRLQFVVYDYQLRAFDIIVRASFSRS